ncbi:hypothetical protein JXR93_12455 [bacterium]|nr:hypothetical protein [bacterium]
MKIFKLLSVFLLIFLFQSCGESACLDQNNEGCGFTEESYYEETLYDSEIDEEQPQIEAMATKATAYTKLETSTYYIENDDSLPEGEVAHILKGEIEIKNLAPEKQVTIHYIGPDNTTWLTADAFYVAPSKRVGYEYWKFFINTPYQTDVPEKFYTFKIQYRVNKNGTWKTYWDTNVNKNYFRTFYTNIVKAKKIKYSTKSTNSPYMLNHVLEVEVEVKNVAFEKYVSLHHVAGDGRWVDTRGYYVKPSTKKYHEIWKVIITTPIYKNPPRDFYRFAVKYNVRMDEYWDNNKNKDYYGMDYIKK